MKKAWVISLLFSIFLICISFAEESDVFSQGEELIYNASYIGIDLGKIKVTSEGIDTLNGIPCYRTTTRINTYPGIPFVDFRVIYREWMDQSLHYSHKFITNTYYDKNDWGYGEINYDYDEELITIKSWRDEEIEFEKYFKTSKKWCNGLTLVFLMRKHAGKNRSFRVPACLNNDTTSAWLHMSGKKEKIYVDAFGKEVNCIYAHGKISTSGLYGLGGDFEVWFTDDEARIPVLGKVNIILGSAKIELVECKRNGWEP